MLPDLERLIRLQALDSAADAARRRIGDTPRLLESLDARLEEHRSRVAAARERLTASQAARREVEKDLAVVQGRLSKYKDQLMEVKTNREYTAMQHEIATAQEAVKSLEDRLLERMLEADELTLAVRAAEQELSDAERAAGDERRTLEAESAQLERSLETLGAERQDLVRHISPAAVELFEHVSKLRRGVAVTEALHGHCAICHVKLRPQVYNEVRRNEAIIQCDSCQRILYFAGPAAPPGAQSPAPSVAK